MATRICPKCSKSRETYFVIEKDPKKKGKSWKIERCRVCGYNFDLEAVKVEPPNADPDKPILKKPDRHYWQDLY